MSDSLRSLFGGGNPYNRLTGRANQSQIIRRQDPFTFSAYVIARNELRVWFEPDWRVARRLAVRFPHCLICSIPEESDTPAYRNAPRWKARPHNGAAV